MTETRRMTANGAAAVRIAVALGAIALPVQAFAQEATPAPAAEAPAEAERLLDVFNYRVEGNTVLARIEVERAVLPYLGPQRKISDVEAARAALEKAYRDKGFETVGVEIPQQDVRGGIVRFNVVELKVGQLRVLNARHFSPKDIAARMPALAEGTVPNYQTVSKQLALINRSSERTVTPTLRAGATADTVDVDLQVEDKSPLHGSLELNDRASSRTRRLRMSGSVSYANLFQLEHSLNVQAQFAPQAPEASWVASASYVAPIRNTPFTVVAYGVHSNSDVTAIGGIGVIGSGDIVGLRGLYNATSGNPADPWIHQVTIGIDYKNFSEDLIVGPGKTNTPIEYVPVMVQYSLARRAQRHEFDVGLTLNAGLRGIGSGEAEFRLKRYAASANWMSLRGDLSYLYKPENGWRFGARVAAQFAGRSLIANEQFSAGGLDSVRGYYESQELGDDGISGQFQIETPSLATAAQRWANDARLFAFADGALTRIHNPLDEQDASRELASVGGGFTIRVFDYLNSSTLVSVPLIDRGSALTDIGDVARVQMRLWASF
jgi:hemolysin activation/secretion protein